MNQALNVHRDPSACKGAILCVYFSRLAFSSVVDHRKLISRYVQTSEICFNSLLNLREFTIADLSATELNANPDLLHDPASWSSCLLPKQSSLLPKQSSLLLEYFPKNLSPQPDGSRCMYLGNPEGRATQQRTRNHFACQRPHSPMLPMIWSSMPSSSLRAAALPLPISTESADCRVNQLHTIAFHMKEMHA